MFFQAADAAEDASADAAADIKVRKLIQYTSGQSGFVKFKFVMV